jgi:DNA-directed RNA polymerase subunit RPC12/RpoP
MEPATEIICVECGGRAHLITPIPTEEELEPGDVLVYRCAECLDRWDVVFEPDDIEETL